MDGFLNWFIVWLVALCLFFGGMYIGISSGQQFAKHDYCQHQHGIYEQIDDIDYCIVDNQLQEIEWVK